MPSIFSKNCIISGPLDYYCLICKKHYKHDEEAVHHITDTKHKKHLNACGYFDKYQEDFIRKVNGLYFCEVCATIFPTATKVKLHIDEPSHEDKKLANSKLTRTNSDVVAFNKFLITDDAWNGLVDETCVLCNTEYDNKDEHMIGQSHILKLINSEVKLDNENGIYREVDERLFHCLSCNELISMEIQDHFSSDNHKKAFKIYDKQSQPITKPEKQPQTHVKVDNKDINDKVKNVDSINKNTVKEPPKVTVDKKKLAADLDEAYCKKLKAKNYIIKKNDEDWCLVCEWSLDCPVEEHFKSKHHQALLKLHKQRLEEKIENKNKDNQIKYENVDKYQKNNINIDFLNEYAFCKKCSKNVDFNTEAIEEHIEEHKKNLNKKSKENVLPFPSGGKTNGTDRTSLFTKPVFMNGNKDNKAELPLNAQDFAKQHGLSFNRADNSFYCKVCSRRLPTTLSDLKKHIASKGHKEKSSKQYNKQIMKPVEKTVVFQFMKSFELIETVDEVNIIINKRYWVNAYGFCLLARFGPTKIMCHACNIDILPENVMHHIITSEPHREAVAKCLVITSMEDELIREIKLDVYHCGYCNEVENDWEDMLEHVATEEHKKKKSEAEHSLHNHTLNPTQYRSMEMDAILEGFGFKRSS